MNPYAEPACTCEKPTPTHLGRCFNCFLKNPAAVALGKLGGKVKSEAKRIATAKSLAKAREVKAARHAKSKPQQTK